MVKSSKQTPITLENLIPAIEKALIPKMEGMVKAEIEKLKYDINERFDNLDTKIKYLPTTETYLKSQDELMGKLDKTDVETKLTGQHYQDVTKRIEFIDSFLQIDSSLA